VEHCESSPPLMKKDEINEILRAKHTDYHPEKACKIS
jgi:hypothetical protein